MGGRVGTGRRGGHSQSHAEVRALGFQVEGPLRNGVPDSGLHRRPPRFAPPDVGRLRGRFYLHILQAKNLNPAECHTARMATTTTSLARGTSHAALATRIRPRAVRRHRVAVRANAKPDATYPGDSDDVDDEDLAYDATEMTYADLPSVPGGSTLDVSRAFTVDIDPSIVTNAMPNRGVLEYVRLPANEYNVLDSSAVQRIDDGTFRINAGIQKILMWEIEPVGTLRIVPTPDGCEQVLLGATMNDVKAARTGKRSKVIDAMNQSLKDLKMANTVSAAKNGAAIKCQIDVAGTFTEGPFAAAGSERLCGLLDWCLRSVLPWFLEQLAVDYRDWACGQPRGRRKVNVTQVASEILAGGKGKLPPGVAESPVEASKISLDEA